MHPCWRLFHGITSSTTASARWNGPRAAAPLGGRGNLPEDILDDLWLVYGAPIVTTLVSVEELEALIERTLARAAQSIEFESGSQAADDQTANVRDLANQPPVVRYVNLLVRNAYQTPGRATYTWRRSGAGSVPATGSMACWSRRWRRRPAWRRRWCLASSCSRDRLAERRRPHDGRVRVRLEERELDLRVSCVPTMFGRGGSTARGPGSVSGKARPALPQRRGGPRRTRILYGHDLDPVGIRVEGVQDQHLRQRPEDEPEAS